MSLLEASSRVALAALLHDLGKFTERAGQEASPESVENHQQLYCPHHKEFTDAKGWFSHKHAAYTGLAFDQVVPKEIRQSADLTPFAAWGGVGADNSLVNAAACHHKPTTFLQWVIAVADRVASGFEREEFEKDYNHAQERPNYLRARLLPLLEQIRLDGTPVAEKDIRQRYPLTAIAAGTIFPEMAAKTEPDSDTTARKEYGDLWLGFVAALEKIPHSHRSNLALWLDHLDSLWLAFTHAIPSATAFGVKPEVSLYDHSKAVAALAVALWRWHLENGQETPGAVKADWVSDKCLLIQGDFFGIQEFIFANGASTNKAAAKLLRGRSFQVSLFTELAALKVLEACELPPTSQIINAAGKFLIVAPNTTQVKQKLAEVRDELDAWFMQHSFGMAGIGLAEKSASCNDFRHGNFGRLMEDLFTDLEAAKLKRFNLLDDASPVLNATYPHGVCPYNGKLPADSPGGAESKPSAALSRDQIKLGAELARKDRLLILRDDSALRTGSNTKLEQPIFGYSVAFTHGEDETGKFGELASSGALLRCWDFSLPADMQTPLWNGYARRFINAYVPRFTEVDQWAWDKYSRHADEADFDRAQYAGKTLNHIACEDRQPRADREGWQGQVALMTLKGDVDNLGLIFQKGLEKPTFAKMAALSRQVNAFFAVWLPTLCAKEFPNTYTVFAGGDDFFLIGPWHSTQALAARMAVEFKRYVAGNADIHFSAGMVMSKPGLPIHTLATQAEEALESAKDNGKNAAVLFDQRVTWSDWPRLQAAQTELERLAKDYGLSTGYVYGLLNLIDLASDAKKPEHAMWRSRFAYRTRRYVVDKLIADERPRAQEQLAVSLGDKGIAQLGGRFRIPLFNYFYRQR